jgi:hypothetical protein
VRLGEVYGGIESNNTFDKLWAQNRCCDESNVAARREAAEEDVRSVILAGIRSEIMGDIFGILDGCWKGMFWGFAVIGIENHTFGAGSDKRTEFAVCTEGWYDESRAAGK